MNRPQRLNAITLQMYEEFDDVLGALAADYDTWVVIITGAGKGFCSGQDLVDLGTDPATSELGPVQRAFAWQERAGRLIRTLHELPQPVIAAVNGAASGGGLSITLAADTRIASRSAKFNVAFVRIGLSGADMGVSYFLPRIVGPTAATEMMYTGRLVQADEALRLGLVLDVVDDGAVVSAALERATAICANSPFAVRLTKQVFWSNLDAASLKSAQDMENRTQILTVQTEDCGEASQAFLDKRPAVFRNR